MGLIATELSRIISLLMEEGIFAEARVWDKDKEFQVSGVSLGYSGGFMGDPYFTLGTGANEQAWHAPVRKTTVIIEVVATDIPRITLVCQDHPVTIVDFRGNDAIGLVEKVRNSISE